MNKSLLKISAVVLLLLSNTVSFGMKTKKDLVDRYSKKPRLLKNESENKSFDFFNLPGELQYSAIRFFTACTLCSFAQTSIGNYSTIERHREMLKPLSKEYLCAMGKGDLLLAQQIKQDNPALPLFYCFPVSCFPSEHERTVLYTFLFFEDDLKSNIGTKEAKSQQHNILYKQALTAGFNDISKVESNARIISGFDIACLNRDYTLIGCKLKKIVDRCEFLGSWGFHRGDSLAAESLTRSLMMAINERDNDLCIQLLDTINKVLPTLRDIVKFYLETLQTLQIINNKESDDLKNYYNLVADKIPSLQIIFPGRSGLRMLEIKKKLYYELELIEKQYPQDLIGFVKERLTR